MATKKIFESEEIVWLDGITTQSTKLPELIAQEETQIATVVIFVISAVLTITLLFVMAIFIDCRQQKLTNAQEEHKRRMLQLRIPKLRRAAREDEATLADKMEQCEPSTSRDIV